MASERVVIQIQLDDGTVKRGFASVTNEARKTAKQTERVLTRGFDNVRGSIDGVIGRVDDLRTAIAGVAAVLAVREIAQSFAEFERGLVGIAKTTNLTNEEVNTLGQSLQELSKQIAVPTSRLVELGQTAGQFGISATDDILKFVSAIGQLELATDLAGEEGAQALVRILNVTGQGVRDIDRFSSAVVALGNNFEVTESQIVPITNEIARSTAAFGVTAQEAAALGTALRTLGARAESSGTAVQRVFLEINKAVSTGNKNLAGFARVAGVSTEQFASAFRDDAFGAFSDFVRGLRAQGSDATVTLQALGLNSTRLQGIILPLAQNFERLEETLALSRQEFQANTALQEEAGRAADTLSGDYIKLANTFSDLVNTVGEVLAPTFRQLAQSSAQSLQVLVDFFDEIRGSGQAIADFISRLGDVIRQTLIFIALIKAPAAFTAFRAALSGLTVTFGRLVVATKAFGASILTLRTQINILKASVTLGLTIALDLLLAKFFELQQEFGNASKAFVALGISIERGFLQAIRATVEFLAFEAPGLLRFFGISATETFEGISRRIEGLNGRLAELREQAEKPITPPTLVRPEGEVGPDGEATGLTDEERNRLVSFQEFFDNFKIGFFQDADAIAAKAADFSKQVGNSLRNGIGVSAANAFAAFGRALATGENALEAFLNQLLASFGQAAIQLGTQFILQGTAYLFAGLPNGPALISAGAALATFGGVLSALGPSSVGPGGNAAGTGGGTIDDLQPDLETVNPDELEEDQRVVVNIQGDVLDSDETGTRIAQILQDSFEAEGVQVVRA